MNEGTNMTTVKREQPLHGNVEGEQLVLRIGIETLAFCAEHCDEFYDDVHAPYPPYLKVLSREQWSQDVLRAMFAEREDGSSLATDFFDAAFSRAYDDGSEAVYPSDEDCDDEL